MLVVQMLFALYSTDSTFVLVQMDLLEIPKIPTVAVCEFLQFVRLRLIVLQE